jgi:hypothetical protein
MSTAAMEDRVPALGMHRPFLALVLVVMRGHGTFWLMAP